MKGKAMHQLGDTMKHVRLVARMARATATDVVTAYDNDGLSSQDWADIIQNCRHCDWADRCEEWLDAHDSATRAPRQCRNRKRFADIKAQDSGQPD